MLGLLIKDVCNENENTFACIHTVTVVFSKRKSVLNFITLARPIKPALATVIIKKKIRALHTNVANPWECLVV